MDDRFAADQRDAVGRAIVDDGMSASEAVAAAKVGALDLPKFEPSESSARRWADDYRKRKRQGLAQPEPELADGDEPLEDRPIDTTTEALQAALDTRVAQLAETKPADVDLLEIKHIARVQADVHKLADLARRTRSNRPTRRLDEPQAPSPLAEQLMGTGAPETNGHDPDA